jgi:hypothetical protein
MVFRQITDRFYAQASDYRNQGRRDLVWWDD